MAKSKTPDPIKESIVPKTEKKVDTEIENKIVKPEEKPGIDEEKTQQIPKPKLPVPAIIGIGVAAGVVVIGLPATIFYMKSQNNN